MKSKEPPKLVRGRYSDAERESTPAYRGPHKVPQRSEDTLWGKGATARNRGPHKVPQRSEDTLWGKGATARKQK